MPTYLEAKCDLDKPVKTWSTRIEVNGPKPCNTLYYLRCNGMGGNYETSYGDLLLCKVCFTTELKIAGYTPGKHIWHENNTLVSATAFIKIFNISSDMEFVYGIDKVEWFLHKDGSIAFRVSMGQQLDGLGLFEKDVEMNASYTLSAYVLTYEPRVELPPSGNFGRKPALEPIPPFFGKRRKIIVTDNPRMLRKFSSSEKSDSDADKE